MVQSQKAKQAKACKSRPPYTEAKIYIFVFKLLQACFVSTYELWNCKKDYLVEIH